jgi:hypothetical protein
LISAIGSIGTGLAVVDAAYARVSAVGEQRGVPISRPAVQAQAHSATGGARQFTVEELSTKTVAELQSLRRTNRRRWQDKRHRGVDPEKIDAAKLYLDRIDAELRRR